VLGPFLRAKALGWRERLLDNGEPRHDAPKAIHTYENRRLATASLHPSNRGWHLHL
jgi:hypothetical protein